jgi:hypothetical protein
VTGENACQMSMSINISNKFNPETYQTNARSDCGRKGVENVNGRIKPS